MDRVDTSDTTLGTYEFIFKHSRTLKNNGNVKKNEALWDFGARQTRFKMKPERSTKISIRQKGFFLSIHILSRKHKKVKNNYPELYKLDCHRTRNMRNQRLSTTPRPVQQ
jgi:hypothetical protein